ncbi:MAG TPA: thermonuclease family protein [Pyrinomonadaceae bacterium]|nr:thermonuclease family protein [Pyrinomonadaceae bacterium]
MCTSVAAVKASSLFGKVIDVSSGDVITIFNLNRPVRIRLLGVDAPELDQAFGDVAKKHLADLIYDKSVVVEYAGIAADKSLTGRVLLGSTDIGAQMIRDGAAWVDPGNQHRLSATDLEVYQQSEQAARNERRGLWQQENPLAPWEFVKTVALRRDFVATLTTVAPAAKPQTGRPASELTNLTLIASRVANATPTPARSLTASELPGILPPVDGGNWRPLRPARENFSVFVPAEGELKTIPIPAGDRMVDSHNFRGRDGRSAFGVSWFAAPTYGESDVDAIKYSLTSFLKGFGTTFDALYRGQQTFSCELQNEKDVSMNGFTGLEFDLSSCTLPARARVFTRTVDGDRQIYLATVFYLEQNDNVERFINSFTITEAKSQKSTK